MAVWGTSLVLRHEILSSRICLESFIQSQLPATPWSSPPLLLQIHGIIPSGTQRMWLPMMKLFLISLTMSISVTPDWWSLAWRRGRWCLLNHCFKKKKSLLGLVLLLLLLSSSSSSFLPSGILFPSCVRSSCTLFPTRGKISFFTLSKFAGQHALTTMQSPKDDPLSGVFFSLLISWYANCWY